jgi:hypothetical protein
MTAELDNVDCTLSLACPRAFEDNEWFNRQSWTQSQYTSLVTDLLRRTGLNMRHKNNLAVVAVFTLALTACSAKGGSMPSLENPGMRSIDSAGESMAQAGIDPHKVHMMRNRYASGPTIDAPQTLQYFGGPVERTPAIYVVFWGFNVAGSDPSGEKPYLTALLRGLGGSTWMATDKQYYQLSGSVKQHIKNPTGELRGTWVDPSTVPASPTDAQIRAEAANAEVHFGYNKNANYIVATPHGHNSPGFGGYCAYHGPTTSSGGEISYTNEPYMTDAGQGCGENAVNPGPAGLLDGVSIVVGHEEAESQTDPQVNVNTAWANNTYGEIGDICAWQGLGNITLSTGKFAMQPLWSNKTSVCTLHTP